ncbi:MAG: hypothetical protein J6B00_02790 [Alphaproteobacteria bacterium]|nr:hypothetical protein [Alphaproteobacteria bacterium]MBP3686795.1 hypothetical protein [Alphaproteobacteria bacterium]
MKKICVLFMLMLVLAGCGLTKKDLGMARSTPDESQVSRRERLVVPPEYKVRP